MSAVVLCAPFRGWLSVLDEVPDAVFAERMMGDGVAIDPLEGVLRAPAAGEIVAVPASAHAVTMRLVNGAELLIHLGLETVALGGRGFRASVAAGDKVEQGDVLIEFDLDQVARAAKDMVTPMVLPGKGGSAILGGAGRLVEVGEPIARVTAGDEDAPSAATGPELRRAILVTAPHGLHARPAARIVARLKPFAAEVTLALGDKRASARSTVAMLALGAGRGARVEAVATGPDAEVALDELARFAGERFGDEEQEAAGVAAPVAGPVCAASGLAIGWTRQLRFAPIAVAEAGQGVEAERRALEAARVAAGAAMPDGELADAHRAILDDPTLHAAAARLIAEGKGAGFAWRAATAEAAAALRATGDRRLAERIADLEDVDRQLSAVLTGHRPEVATLEYHTILLADDLLPSQFLALDPARLAGICTARGGPTAHVAILAAAAGVPMVVAAGPDVLSVADGSPAILDADAARLTVAPDPATLNRASATVAARQEARAAERAAAQAPCTTADGVRIEVFANLGSAEEAGAAVREGAEGCGLLRSEFLFLDRATAPSEDEQRDAYARIATVLGDRPLIVRTLDIGGDKPVPYLPMRSEDNPALGQRGVRLSLARPDLLGVQLRAILAGVPGAQCRIMLPMITDTGEIAGVRALLAEAMAATGRTAPVELGVMIETPAAAVLADQIAREVDFLSIGTNDLTQYALAADRGNALVASMVDALHPAVLRLIARTAEGARRHGRWVGVCGGLASDSRAAALLVGLGVTELSAVPAAVPAIKAAVRATTTGAAEALARRALDASSADEVRALIAAGMA